MRAFSPRLLFPIYGLGVIGSFLQVAGAQWDVSWHILGIVESFLQPAHFVLYAGIGSVAIANLFGLRFALKYENISLQQLVSYILGRTHTHQPYSKLLTGIRIAAIGTGLQLLAGPFDFYWHNMYGFDPFLFTPAHSILIAGLLLDGIGMLLGTVRLLQLQRDGISITSHPRLLTFFTVLGLASIWLILNFASYWITDTTGMAYTLNICSKQQFETLGIQSCSFVTNPFAVVISDVVSTGTFAGSGVITFLTAKKLFPKKGLFTSATLVAASVYSVLALGFISYALSYLNPPGTFYLSPSPQAGAQLASFIPLYLLSVTPLAAFDLLTRPSRWRLRTAIVLAAILGPFSALIDGRYSLRLVDASFNGIILVTVAEVIGGILAAILFNRLNRILARAPETQLPEMVTAKSVAVR